MSAASGRSHAWPRGLAMPGIAQLLEAGIVVAAFVLATLILARSYDTATSVWIVTLVVAALAVWIVVQDLRTFTIADGAIVSIVCLALAERWSSGDTALALGLDCLLTGGVLLAFREFYYRRRGFDGLGLGDVKLAAAGGLLVGATAFAWALLAASLLALGFVAISRLASRTASAETSFGGPNRLAFGAVLAPAVWIAWVGQNASLLLPLAGP